jgi:MFS family permease
VLRANTAGLSDQWIPLALAAMNVTYVISVYPAGWLSDRTGRIGLLMLGLAILIAADVVLAFGVSLGMIFAGIGLWGLHMGLTQGIFAALVADTAPDELRGSGFGVFNFVSGIVAVFASVLAGALWKWYGPPATFFVGAAFSVLALVLLLGWWLRHPRKISRNSGNH